MINDASPAKDLRDDPVESHVAAASVKDEHISKLKRLILDTMLRVSAMSDEGLCGLLRIQYPDFFCTDAGIRSRRAELQARGYIEDTKSFGITMAGCACRLRRLTEAGRKEVQA